jgi:hypothetical protein
MAAGRVPQHRPARIGVRERPGQPLVGVCPIQVQAVQLHGLAVGRVGHDRRLEQRRRVTVASPGRNRSNQSANAARCSTSLISSASVSAGDKKSAPLGSQPAG